MFRADQKFLLFSKQVLQQSIKSVVTSFVCQWVHNHAHSNGAGVTRDGEPSTQGNLSAFSILVFCFDNLTTELVLLSQIVFSKAPAKINTLKRHKEEPKFFKGKIECYSLEYLLEV